MAAFLLMGGHAWAQSATARDSVATGAGSQATGIFSTAIGALAQATGDSTTAIGTGAMATGDSSTAIGRFAQATDAYSTAIGDTAQAAGPGSVALGPEAQANGEDSVALGSGSTTTEDNTVSVGSGDGRAGYPATRRIVNVGDGMRATDAVNKRQLDAMGGRLSQGVANTAANAGMAPLPAGAANGFTAGISRYNGKQGLAAGFQHRLNANTVLKAAVGTGTTGQPVTAVGLSYTWGGSMPSSTTTGGASQADIAALQDQLRSTKTDLARANTKAERMRAELDQTKAEATAKANAAEAKANTAEAKAERMQAELADVLHRLAMLEGKQVAAK
jgi:hypothetical protein